MLAPLAWGFPKPAIEAESVGPALRSERCCLMLGSTVRRVGRHHKGDLSCWAGFWSGSSIVVLGVRAARERLQFARSPVALQPAWTAGAILWGRSGRPGTIDHLRRS